MHGPPPSLLEVSVLLNLPVSFFSHWGSLCLIILWQSLSPLDDHTHPFSGMRVSLWSALNLLKLRPPENCNFLQGLPKTLFFFPPPVAVSFFFLGEVFPTEFFAVPLWLSLLYKTGKLSRSFSFWRIPFFFSAPEKC